MDFGLRWSGSSSQRLHLYLFVQVEQLASAFQSSSPCG